MNEIYSQYWKRKELLKSQIPTFPVLEYYESEKFSPAEEIFFKEIKNAASILDFGAGNLSVMRKLQNAGVKAQYETLDVSDEFNYTYRSISEVTRKFDAILFLDVLEHLPLKEGLSLLNNLTQLLNKNGVIVIQTPNARCVRNPLSWDMTHVQCYNAPDLWTYLSCLDLQVKGYRVNFSVKNKNFFYRIRFLLSQVFITKFLGMDYADNIIMVCKR